MTALVVFESEAVDPAAERARTAWLLDQVGWVGDSPLYALTHEGRLERFSQRVGVFA